MRQTATMTLTEFLLERIAEDEAAALRICPGRSAANGRWRRGAVQDEAVRAIDPLHADHILRHDPARVLADCEARRRIVERFQQEWDDVPELGGPGEDWKAIALEEAVMILANVYADHPDYREEWKP